jgi:hypothetical protein
VLEISHANWLHIKRLERQHLRFLTTTGVSLFNTTMSLVGSEVDVSGHSSVHRRQQDRDENAMLSNVDNGMDVDPHPPPSPPSPAERLFLCDVPTQCISATALAEQIHQSSSSKSHVHRRSGNLSVQTDGSTAGWVTASGIEDDSLCNETPTLHPISSRSSDTIKTPFSETDDEDSAYENFFKKDILSRKIRDLSEVDEDNYLESDMATPVTTSSSPTKFFPTEAPQHVDAAETVYDTAKGVWAWGKGVMIFKPFLGLTEVVASKVAGMVGSDLASVDGAFVHKLHEIDDSMLNPAIAAILGALLGAAGKTEDVLMPLVISILKPLGLIKDSAENPELTTVPGVTVQ